MVCGGYLCLVKYGNSGYAIGIELEVKWVSLKRATAGRGAASPSPARPRHISSSCFNHGPPVQLCKALHQRDGEHSPFFQDRHPSRCPPPPCSYKWRSTYVKVRCRACQTPQPCQTCCIRQIQGFPRSRRTGRADERTRTSRLFLFWARGYFAEASGSPTIL